MRLSTNPLISFPNKNLDSLKENCARSPALCLSNPILLVVATFERVQGEKSGLAKALRSVECGVCLRGEKICHFGAVVYSNVRERTNEKLLRSTLPASFPPPLLLPPPFPSTYSLLSTTCLLPHLETLSQHEELQVLRLLCEQTRVCELSVRQGEFGFLLIVSSLNYSDQVGVFPPFWSFSHHHR